MACRDLSIGFASAQDAGAIALMSRDLVEAGLGWQYDRARVAELIADRDNVVVVARHDPRIAGFASMSFRDDRAHLALLAVQPLHQRQGVASALMRWLTASAEVAGVASIHVELRESNAPARALYERAGFNETLRIPGYYRGRETAVRMMRLLRAPDVPLPAWRFKG